MDPPSKGGPPGEAMGYATPQPTPPPYGVYGGASAGASVPPASTYNHTSEERPYHGTGVNGAPVVVQGLPVYSTAHTGSGAPTQASKCAIFAGIITVLFLIVGIIVTLPTNIVVFSNPNYADFEGRMTHFRADFYWAGPDATSSVPPLSLGISDWHQIPALGAMKGAVQLQTATLILSLFAALYLLVIQFLRLMERIRSRKIYTHSTAGSVVFILIMMAVGEIATDVGVYPHVDALLRWLEVEAGLQGMVGSAGGGMIALVMLCYVPTVILLAFAIRTWVGPRCQTCCCDCCCCALAPERDMVEDTASRRAVYVVRATPAASPGAPPPPGATYSNHAV